MPGLPTDTLTTCAKAKAAKRKKVSTRLVIRFLSYCCTYIKVPLVWPVPDKSKHTLSAAALGALRTDPAPFPRVKPAFAPKFHPAAAVVPPAMPAMPVAHVVPVPSTKAIFCAAAVMRFNAHTYVFLEDVPVITCPEAVRLMRAMDFTLPTQGSTCTVLVPSVTFTDPIVADPATKAGAVARVTAVVGIDAMLTGWVVCQKVPVTAVVGIEDTETLPLTGWVACQKVPVTGVLGMEAMVTAVVGMEAIDTGCVVCQKVPVTAVVGMEAMETGCVVCQNVPDTGWVACQNVPVTGVDGIEEIVTGTVLVT